MEEKLNKAAEEYAFEILGEEQFNDPEFKTAKEGIMYDFTEGAKWMEKYLSEK